MLGAGTLEVSVPEDSWGGGQGTATLHSNSLSHVTVTPRQKNLNGSL